MSLRMFVSSLANNHSLCRPVKVIRLIGKNTCEEIILKRAEAKLKLTESVMEGGHFSHTPQDLLTDKEFKVRTTLYRERVRWGEGGGGGGGTSATRPTTCSPTRNSR